MKEYDSLLTNLLKNTNISENPSLPHNKHVFLELFLRLTEDDGALVSADELKNCIKLCDTMQNGKKYKSILETYQQQHSLN